MNSELLNFKRLTKNLSNQIKLTSNEKKFTYVSMPTDDHKRWKNIESSLKFFASNPQHTNVYSTLLSYNEEKPSNFSTFEYYTEHQMGDKRSFNRLLGDIANCALRMPALFENSLQILVKGIDSRVTLSEFQMCCLLCNAFFCTILDVPKSHRGHIKESEKNHNKFKSLKYAKTTCGNGSPSRFERRESSVEERCPPNMPTFNFFYLFGRGREGRYDGEDLEVEMKSEKLKCIFQYFKEIFKRMEIPHYKERMVTFHRQVLASSPDWANSKNKLTNVIALSKGLIENADHFLQVDFANKMVGGGVLGRGCVQEEIRFVICPELIVSRLITEELGDKECLIVTGVERFSKYSGYSKTFKFEGEWKDHTPMDIHRRIMTQILVMDAMKFSYEKQQFDDELVLREMNKAYSGFKCEDFQKNERPAIATGNWGCGAFKGNKELKFLIQLMAASEASREMCYYTFNDENLAERLTKICCRLSNSGYTVGDLYSEVHDAIPSSRVQGKFFDCLNIVERNSNYQINEDSGENSFNIESSPINNSFLKDWEY